ncbi:MAG: hypothetical protein EZS28_021623 [Streblomastix strix]|uniref:Uncharacterized protein n=1 Tax=Streblomastix strix TaxID=222440 RepID=A0A5J4VJU9_9EUKA|nr:MAG: hypothetical protein EZS28_021623 [Streblomastix strix]
MRTDIINHLVSLILNSDKVTSNMTSISLGQLAQNAENRAEIIKGIDFKSISEIFRKPKDDDLRKTIINSGVLDSLFFILDTHDLSSVTLPYVDVIQQLSNCSIEIKLMLQSKKPYPHLLYLLNHTDNDVILYAINSIFNILGFGAKQTSSSSQHPHFETMSTYGGVDKLYSVFKRSDVNKKVKDKAAICIGKLYSSKELQGEMKTEIISYLKIQVNSSDSNTKVSSVSTLKGLAQNPENKIEIEKEEFKIPK